ncbi:DNA-directed RNA polymerase I, second largest subunit, putative [Theileria annulata]|uniref:DNA-directed RNA polymerase subunit beta n=1 Tax=Theileria annulata TaxID=5874 RepID=Q4U9X6_THEAN|nr:DNA-directed RNA polymerase I, second largest subunit, putative [Theileria annulata]CAI76377.1 DNA-directed RNA polymerase I, second largest subunit, putative [Theileria annulata]|eukprot:XP_953002.1 DNA-directed RNA polymerase I, second largest subunit, putative [Theileria annulata]
MPEINQNRLNISESHVESFNTFIDHYSFNMVNNIPPVYITHNPDPLKSFLNPKDIPYYLKVSIISLKIGYPTRPGSECIGTSQKMYPRHAKTTHTTYEAPLIVTFGVKFFESESIITKEVPVGHIPIMVRSNRCNLKVKFVDKKFTGLSGEEMIKQGEDLDEPGGYFIIRGNEKMIRQLIVPRSNYPIAFKSESNSQKNVLFTEYSIFMRCQSDLDGTCVSNYLHLTINKRCMFRVIVRNSVVLVPLFLLLRALLPLISEDEFKRKLLENCSNNQEMTILYHRIFLDMAQCDPVLSDIDFIQNRYLYRLGKACWNQVSQYLHPGSTFEECAQHLIKYFVIIHAKSNLDKFRTLLFMFNKLVNLSNGNIQSESYDSFAFQEIMLAGQSYSCILKESLYLCLTRIRTVYNLEINNFLSHLKGKRGFKRNFTGVGKPEILDQDLEEEMIRKFMNSVNLFNFAINKVAPEVTKKIHHFLSTGNAFNTHYELNQSTGFAIVLDRINYHRFSSHLRSIHRGNIFMKMRSTQVRKLLGETWGFICPVHTPDGAPCGLLLHLSQYAKAVTTPNKPSYLNSIKSFLKSQRLHNTGSTNKVNGGNDRIPLVVDGIPVAYVDVEEVEEFYDKLRTAKNLEKFGMCKHFETCAMRDKFGVFSSIYIMTFPGRLVRPVRNIKDNQIELIGPITQLWSTIAINEYELNKSHNKLLSLQSNPSAMNKVQVPKVVKSLKDNELDNCPVLYEYVELDMCCILSLSASLTPFSNHNQSPRNMYQCQMLKQSVGIPFHSQFYRSEVKTYVLTSLQRPLVATKEYEKMGFQDYPTGVNCVVAIIAHSGFDMEDAMILNKASVDRGLFNSFIYKSKVVDLNSQYSSNKERGGTVEYFNNMDKDSKLIVKKLDFDGLPRLGEKLTKNSPFYRIEEKGKNNIMNDRVVKYTDEPAIVDQITLVGKSDLTVGDKISCPGLKHDRAIIKLRVLRSPIVGDKFASRHGQKGILSAVWPTEDMPFLENGIVPDVIFNPHGLPSRMTIGKLIEGMAGKVASIYGKPQDSTCFQTYYSENNDKGNEEMEEVDVVDYFGKSLISAGYEYYGTESMYCGTLGTEIQTHIFVGLIYYQRLRHMVSDKAQVRATGPVDTITKQPVKGRKNLGGIRFGEMERDALIAHGTANLLQDRLLHCSDAHMAYVCPKCGSILSPSISSLEANTKRQVSICTICQVNCKLVTIPYVLR